MIDSSIVDSPMRMSDAIVACCKALASPIRLQMVALIHEATAPLCACDIEQSFALSQPTISHHLRILRDAGIVTATSRGTNTYYQLDETRMEALVYCLAQFSQPKGIIQ